MAKYGKPRSTKGLATLCARIADDKIAENILVLNLSKIEFAPAEYFIICSCETDIQSRAIVDEIKNVCSEFDISKPKIEGLEVAHWIIIDFFDVVIHIMLKETRAFYQLEKLWGDAQFFNLNENGELRAFKSKKIEKELN